MDEFKDKLMPMIRSGASARDILSSFGCDISGLDANASALFSNLILLVAALNSTIEEMSGKMDDVSETLNDIKSMLLEKKNMDSRNSSMPPSREGYSKPDAKDRSLREASGRKPGGQRGHKGHGLKKIIADEKETVDHYPSQCMGCAHFEECRAMMKSIASGHVYECRTVVVDLEHKAYSIVCPMMKELLEGEMPHEVASTQQYGTSIKSSAVSIWAQGCTSIARLTSLLSRFIKSKISEGTAFSIIEDFAKRCDSSLEVIREYLGKCKVKGADETGLRTDGSLHWLHIVCDKSASYLYADKKRGFEAISNDCSAQDCFMIISPAIA